ncbi:DUF2013 domain-containing protein [Aspergillus chevalieri]|uniref:SPIN90/Ldb17 leucine-rich domain-containing protein n=1 Tax=Aspergillus chevalieri TaxID=182096 RepID=A0A7R7VFW9_ASPCH|nr:uncharacterized protein ACHE_10436S [Aspergillus chevalieri]BCR83034.1 hypothetical protein ACHE_10436S [Aspergillus chevalieri]
MESEVILEREQQFWDELQQIVSTPCDSEDLIDNVLRSYLSLTVQYKDEYLNSELDISRCSFKLFSSTLYASHGDYVRRQLLYGLLQEDDPKTLHLISSFLLFDGRQNEATFHAMNDEGAFPRLLELLQKRKNDSHGHSDEDEDGGAGLHRMLMDLLYEMSRVQRVKIGDLVLVDDDFIKGLFELIENLSDDVNDPYHYPVIRVLLVLNEQFMISAHDPIDERSGFLTNKVIKVLSMQGNYYKTFGENIILLINREAETSLQLLTLKLLYLLFTTPSTFEYFYTNDLRVLVDILIRNLLDLPEEASALRHTYLRVLYPLLAHTQLRYPPYYKRDELKRMLNILMRGQLSGQETDEEKIQHFEDVDETTKRLVMRCATVEWLRDVEPEVESQAASRTGSVFATTGEPLEASQITSSSSSSDRDTASPTGHQQAPGSPDVRHHHRKLSAVKRLGMHLEPASTSSLSVREVASQHEKPGVITPSRADLPPETEFVHPGAKPKPKVKPEPPKARRWRGRRNHEEDENADRIPEDSPIPSSPIPRAVTPTPPPPPPIAGNRRRSTSTSSSLAPPVSAHSRRSASNPPPAVPPPRRSATHPAVQSQNSQYNNQSNLNSMVQQGKYGQRPEPPKTRRWGRKQAQQSEQSGTREHTVSVEEAVQNASLE